MIMKYIYCVIFLVTLFSLDAVSQHRKDIRKGKITVLTENTNDSLILYVINDKYYIGDTKKNLIQDMDISKIKNIKQISDKRMKTEYLKDVNKISKKIKDVFVIKTEEKFNYKK